MEFRTWYRNQPLGDSGEAEAVRELRGRLGGIQPGGGVWPAACAAMPL